MPDLSQANIGAIEFDDADITPVAVMFGQEQLHFGAIKIRQGIARLLTVRLVVFRRVDAGHAQMICACAAVGNRQGVAIDYPIDHRANGFDAGALLSGSGLRASQRDKCKKEYTDFYSRLHVWYNNKINRWALQPIFYLWR